MKFKTNAIRFLFISILGVLLHFTYEWSDDNRIVELFFFHEKMPANYLWARTLGILSGMIFIVAVFYTLNGILGTNYDWINIALYFAGVIFALFVENDVYRNGKAEKLILSSAILLLLTAAFFTFTEYPPQLGIFQ